MDKCGILQTFFNLLKTRWKSGKTLIFSLFFGKSWLIQGVIAPVFHTFNRLFNKKSVNNSSLKVFNINYTVYYFTQVHI